jgi:hypothetical protein
LWIVIATMGCERRPVELGFWLEPVAYASSRLGDPVTPAELATIESIAREEIQKAFDGFDVMVSDNRQARHSVRVVPALKDQRLRRDADVAGASRGMAGLGGSGAVSFEYLANGATVFSPDTAGRAQVIEALGRGIGRVAIHEFLHQLLPRFPIHDSRDPYTYEGNSPATMEGYFHDLRWGIAEPLLEQRLGRR